MLDSTALRKLADTLDEATDASSTGDIRCTVHTALIMVYGQHELDQLAVVRACTATYGPATPRRYTTSYSLDFGDVTVFVSRPVWEQLARVDGDRWVLREAVAA